MELKSLGHRTRLIFPAFDGKVTSHTDRIAIHTLGNPNFFWGNLLIFDRPPQRGDFDNWTRQFREEFTDPRIYHVTLAWDSTTGEIGDPSEFIEHGFRFEADVTLSATKVIKPPKFNDELEVRKVSTAEAWEQMIAIQVATGEAHLSKAEWESFSRKQSLRYRALEKAGFGHWYGGYFKDQLVSGLGLYHRNGLARFQSVSTHPEFQRRGFCQSLVYQVSRDALASGNVTELVMCADPDYHAIRVYESVGFERRMTEHGVYWWDKSREGS